MRKLLLLVCAIVLVDTMFYAGLTPLLPHLSETFGLGKTGAGILTGAYAAGALAGALPGGLSAARAGVRPTVLAGLGVMSLTSIAFGFAETIWALDTARFLQGFASAFTWIGALTWLVEAAPRARRGEVIGLAMSGAIVGALLGPALGGIASVVGRGPTFSAIAGLGAILALAAWALPAPAPARRQPLRRVAQALRKPIIVAGLWFSVVPGFLLGTLSVLAPLQLHDIGYGALAIGAIFIVSGAIEATVSPLFGRLSDRVGRLGPLRFGLAASAVLSLLLAVPSLNSHLALPILVACTGLGYGAFWAPGMALLSDGAESAGLIYAYGFMLMDLAWSPGNAIGSIVSGSVAQAIGDAAPYLIGASLCIATLVVTQLKNDAITPLAAAKTAES